MYEYHILNAIRGGEHLSFHTPGHKCAADFVSFFPGGADDITELSYSDNLVSPSGAIQKAQDDIARILGADASFITTDGSTSGIYAMLYVARKRGRKVIVPRYSHMSVFNACIVFGLEPVIASCSVDQGVPQIPTAQEVEKLVKINQRDLAAVLIVSPDYYGNVAEYGKMRDLADEYGFMLLFDGAHGAHLVGEPGLHCSEAADIWVDGCHKSLPTLTQGAVVSSKNKIYTQDLEEAMRVFRTSSPSYPVMASVEYGMKYAANHPKAIREGKRISARLSSAFPVKTYDSRDWTKVCADFFDSGMSPRLVEEELERRRIYPEFNDGRHILFYLSASIETMADGIVVLSREMEDIARSGLCRGECDVRRYFAGERVCGFLEAVNAPSEYVFVDEAVGRTAAVAAGISPPCIPQILPGEKITREIADVLGHKGAFGLRDGKIKVMA